MPFSSVSVSRITGPDSLTVAPAAKACPEETPTKTAPSTRPVAAGVCPKTPSEVRLHAATKAMKTLIGNVLYGFVHASIPAFASTKHESFQWKVHECLLRMLILINDLRSVRTDRCGPIERGLGRSTARLRRFRQLVDNLRCR